MSSEKVFFKIGESQVQLMVGLVRGTIRTSRIHQRKYQQASSKTLNQQRQVGREHGLVLSRTDWRLLVSGHAWPSASRRVLEAHKQAFQSTLSLLLEVNY